MCIIITLNELQKKSALIFVSHVKHSVPSLTLNITCGVAELNAAIISDAVDIK